MEQSIKTRSSNGTEVEQLEAARKYKSELLGFLADVCTEKGIGYFIFSETLEGAVYYQDFVPKSKRIFVGILRSDYNRFKEVIPARAKEHGYVFEDYEYFHPGVLKRVPFLRIANPVELIKSGDRKGGASSSSVRPYIPIAIFDALPDGHDVKLGHLRRMKKLNRKATIIKKSREILFEGRTPGKTKRSLPTMLWYACHSRRAIAEKIHAQAQRYNGQGMKSVMRLAGPRTRIIELSGITPYKRVKFGPLELNAPNDLSVWVAEASPEYIEKIRPLQDDIKRIALEVDRVCGELGIDYFLCGGTLLGYVRHKGYIPWDDDMDLGMLRKDYDTFVAKAGTLLGDEFFLQTRTTDPQHSLPFHKG